MYNNEDMDMMQGINRRRRGQLKDQRMHNIEKRKREKRKGERSIQR